jgi:hypothetical protein
MSSINNHKTTAYAIISFSLIQLTIYFTNRSQIFYINMGLFSSFYKIIFICLYQLGFIVGSLFNQFFINKFGVNGTYIVLFAISCIALLFHNLYESYWSWLFFRFIYSFCIAGLYWIFNDHFSIQNKNIRKNISIGTAKLTIVRFSNIISSILISILNFSYDKMAVVSVIMMQFAQIFFSLNNKNNLALAKPINDLKFYLDIYFQIYEKNKIFCIYFLLLLGVHNTYITWLIIIASNLQNTFQWARILIVVFALGEIVSNYLFMKNNYNIGINQRIYRGYFVFAIINFLIFLILYNQGYLFLFPILFIGGIVSAKIVSDLELLVFENQNITNKTNFDFSNTIIKYLLNIGLVIITYHITSYKIYIIFFILFLLFISFSILGLKKITFLWDEYLL